MPLSPSGDACKARVCTVLLTVCSFGPNLLAIKKFQKLATEKRHTWFFECFLVERCPVQAHDDAQDEKRRHNRYWHKGGFGVEETFFIELKSQFFLLVKTILALTNTKLILLEGGYRVGEGFEVIFGAVWLVPIELDAKFCLVFSIKLSITRFS